MDQNYKADMGDHFDKNEKNLPGGATVAKLQFVKLSNCRYTLFSKQAEALEKRFA